MAEKKLFKLPKYDVNVDGAVSEENDVGIFVTISTVDMLRTSDENAKIEGFDVFESASFLESLATILRFPTKMIRCSSTSLEAFFNSSSLTNCSSYNHHH